jgi:hypothetical protein
MFAVTVAALSGGVGAVLQHGRGSQMLVVEAGDVADGVDAFGGIGGRRRAVAQSQAVDASQPMAGAPPNAMTTVSAGAPHRPPAYADHASAAGIQRKLVSTCSSAAGG